MRQFRDRRDAGRQLAARLGHLRAEDPVVVGLPRGGVPVAFEVARALDAPLDVIVVRKLGVPFQPELGMGLRPDTIGLMIIWLFVCLAGAVGPVANTAHFVGLAVGMAAGVAPHWRDVVKRLS